MNNRKNLAEIIRHKAGKFLRGKKNSITDLKDVKTAHLSLNKDFQQPSGEKISIRTGLTAIVPYKMEREMRLFASCFILGGKNEVTGYEVIDDFCYINSPLVITNSFNVGRAYNAVLSYGFSLNRSEIWPPFIIGLDDSYLNDLNKSVILEKDILKVLYNASDGKVEQGSVGIGVGLRSFNWKGGIGTSSRIFSVGSKHFMCGVLVATNHGNQQSAEKNQKNLLLKQEGQGSLTIIVAVDVPLVPYQIKQISQRLVASIASVNLLNNCSDSITCVLFSTANPLLMEDEGPFIYNLQLVEGSLLNELILAGTEAMTEAVLNSLWKAKSITGKSGRRVATIPEEEFIDLLNKF